MEGAWSLRIEMGFAWVRRLEGDSYPPEGCETR